MKALSRSELQKRIFVSYSRLDARIVYPLIEFLRAAGNTVFYDKDNLEYGADWTIGIEEAIRTSSRFLLFWSKNAAASRSVAHEIKLALANTNIVFVPVLLDGTPLREPLKRLHAHIDFANGLFNVMAKPLHTRSYIKVDTSETMQNLTKVIKSDIFIWGEDPAFYKDKALGKKWTF